MNADQKAWKRFEIYARKLELDLTAYNLKSAFESIGTAAKKTTASFKKFGEIRFKKD